MEVTETSSEGLKREFRIIVSAGDLESEITHRLGEINRSLRLPGFRPGKVPMQLLRKRYGSAVLGEVLEKTVEGSSAEALRERQIRPALQPKVEIVSFKEGADLEYKMSVEILPEIPKGQFENLGIEKLVTDVPDEDIDKAVQRLADQQRKAEKVERPAETGDVVLIDFLGRTEDGEIPGGKGEDFELELGSGRFIPGFEEQLVGVSAGEHREVNLSFPEDYASADLAGKTANFAVDLKEVRQRLPAAVDDALATAVGLENLAELRDEIRSRMMRDYNEVARQRLKRALLDKLAERYDFAVPEGMVEIEFQNIWQQYEAEKKRQAEAASPAGDLPTADSASDHSAEAAEAEKTADPQAAAEMPGGTGASQVDVSAAEESVEGGEDETAKAEYRKIAERRVRLGLVLAEVGRENNITVSQEEINQALTREARRHPGQEREVLEFFRQHPEQVANLQAPIFEEKVVDFIVELARPEERHVTPQELLAEPADEPDTQT